MIKPLFLVLAVVSASIAIMGFRQTPGGNIVASAGSTTTTVATANKPNAVYLQWSMPTFSGTGIRSNNITPGTGAGGGTSASCQVNTSTTSSSYSGTTKLEAYNSSEDTQSSSFGVIVGVGVGGSVHGGTDDRGCNSTSSLGSLSRGGSAGGGTGQVDYADSGQSSNITVPTIPPGEDYEISTGSVSGSAYYNGNNN